MGWLIGLLILVIIWLLMIWPSDYFKEDKEKLRKFLYAHRGLHSEAVPENSIAAFDDACNAGYGSELDLQFSKDKKVVVFHDDGLKRMCGVDKLVSELTYDELLELKLKDTDQHIPLFTEVLDCVNGRTPLVVELKTCPDYKELVKATQEILKDYKGDYCIESFNPMIVRRYAKTLPLVHRGLLVTNHVRYKTVNTFLGFAIQNMLMNFIARPQFIACHKDDWNMWGVKAVRFLFRPVLATWTIKNAEEFEKVKDMDIIIFEDFLPDASRPELNL